MELAFLGTGAAFSGERYNGAVVVDRRLLLDGGAPLLPHMHRLGIDPGGIGAVFLTHFHGDHMLGLPTFVLHRALVDRRPFTVVGPAGVEATLEALFKLSWGTDWEQMRGGLKVRYLEAGDGGSAAGVDFRVFPQPHGSIGCLGYRLRMPDGRDLAYSGDTEGGPALDALVEGAAVAIVEATGPGNPHSHLSWEAAADLRGRHPDTRFFFNHLYAGSFDGAAADLQVVQA